MVPKIMTFLTDYSVSNKEYPYWAIYYEKEGYDITGDKLMGRQAAGWSFLKAIVGSKTQTIGTYIKNLEQREFFKKDIQNLLTKDQSLDIKWIPYNEPYLSEPFGGIFVPGPGIAEFSIPRSFFGHDRYSLIGITHTTASTRVMDSISSLLTKPVMPWDAIICTSNCVLDTVNKILESQKDFLSKKYTIKDQILPKLPIIPLGIDEDEFDFSNEFIQTARKEFNINENDIVIVYVGRLSFHAKAHHLPMYVALEKCAKRFKDKRIHLIQTGWFHNEFIEKTFKNEALDICPSVITHFVDGKDQNNKHLTLACGDIFISLSDNIQETFGITPLEAMASGLPVIVSDWNGYKENVQHNVDGFRIPSISLKKGLGDELAYEHNIGKISYDLYVASASISSAINVKDCIEKLELLIGNENLRNKFAASAKTNAKNKFSWSTILKDYQDLSNELDSIRLTESDNYKDLITPFQPSNALDPFFIFESYPTLNIDEDTILEKISHDENYSIEKVFNLNSTSFEGIKSPTLEELKAVYNSINDKDDLLMSNIIEKTGIGYKSLSRTVIWLIKFGFLAMNGKIDD